MSNRATTTAKGRPKKSYARGKSRKEDPEAMILWMPDETFCEEMSEWVDRLKASYGWTCPIHSRFR